MRSRRLFASAGLALTLAVMALPPAAEAQFIVHDPTSFIEFAKSSKAALDQITNQIEQINQLKGQLSNQALMLQKLQTDITGPIAQITGQATSILQQAQGIGYSAQNVAQQFASLYPKSMPGASLAATRASLATWRDNNTLALQDALQMQNQIANGQTVTAGQVAQAVQASQGAAGQTAAVQATNQLLATVSGQLTQLQSLLITQARAEQTLAAQAQASQAVGKADSERLWSYTPRASRVQNPGQL